MLEDATTIARFVNAGELIPLLCTVAEMTGDKSLLDDAFRPRLQAELITIPANGGVDDAAAALARERITDALIRQKDAPGGFAARSNISVEELADFLSGGAKDHTELLSKELGADCEKDEVTWTKAAIAPDRKFVVGIIGAGPAGLAMAYKLYRAGVDFVIFDKNGEVGGTWYLNRYPGCRLDTGRLSYSFSFAQRRDWRHLFTEQGDLLRYYKGFAAEAGLAKSIHFNSEVVAATYQEEHGKWALKIRNLRSKTESDIIVDALISAVGVLHQPKIPEFAGAERFRGQTVHSACWHDGVDYRGKRVSIIGTGASAYQIGPSIVKDVASLNIFQRSAPWMLPTPTYHHEVSPEARWLNENLPRYHQWLRLWEFWNFTIGKYALTKADPNWDRSESVSEPNHRFRADLVERIRNQYVGRDDLLQSVIPTYPVGAKRMLRDNGVWAETLKSPHVKLVTDPIKGFDENGIATVNGDHYDSDLIIYATGFDVANYLGTVDVRGRDGRKLREFWGDEARAHLGITVPGFPNLFVLSGPNTGLVAIGSQTFMIECAVNYISRAIEHLLRNDLRSMEPTEQAYQDFVRWVDEGNKSMAWGAAKVQSWYRNSRGTVVASWPYPLLTYWQITRNVDAGALETRPCSTDQSSSRANAAEKSEAQS